MQHALGSCSLPGADANLPPGPDSIAGSRAAKLPRAEGDAVTRPIDIDLLERTYSVVPIPDGEAMRRSFDISPDEREVCFTWNRSGTFQVWLAPLDRGDARQLTHGDVPSIEPRWSPDGRHVFFLRDEGGNENFGFWRASVDSGDARPFAVAKGAARRSLEFSPDGSRLACISNEGGGAFQVWTMASDGSGARQLSSGTEPVMLARWSPVDERIGVARMSEGGASIAVVDAGSGEERTIARTGGFPSTLAWSPDGATLACNDDVDGRATVVLVNVSSGRTRALVRSEWEPEGCAFSPDGRAVAYTLNRDGNFDLVLQDLEAGTVRVANVGDGIHAAPEFMPDGRSVVAIVSGATQPPDLWRIPLDGGQPEPVTDSVPADVPRESLTPARVVRYPSAGGASVPALLYAPPTTGTPRPAVVFVHGGPTAQHTNTWYPVVQYLASHGFAVLAPNYRGSTGYGAAWRDAAVRDWGGVDLADVVAGAEYLAREGLADPQRIAVMGASYGGYLTLMALASAPEAWGAGVSLVGIADLRTLYATTRESDARPYLEQQIGTPGDNPQLYDARSPIRLVERIRAPVLLLQGANDPRVPLSEAETMAERLRAAGRSCELKVYPDEGHGFMHTANRLDSMRTALAFLRRHLG
jgi:dipeptidyl aminopeptidase/acylaminoacyl peptidase